MTDWMGWVLILGVPLAVIGLGVPLGRWFYRRARRESGWNQWRQTAATLPWRDRWRLLWATSSGRAVSDPRLAELAAQRAEAAHGLLSKAARRQTWLLRFVGLAQLVVAISALSDGNSMGWFYLLTGLAFLLVMPVALRFDRRRVARSAVANRRPAKSADPD